MDRAAPFGQRRIVVRAVRGVCHAILYDGSVAGSWDRRIRRAEQLAANGGPASSLLAFYARLLQKQKAVYDALNDRRPSGSIERDLALVTDSSSGLLHEVAEYGPAQLVAEARALLASDNSATKHLLLSYWHDRSDRQFFAKALLQPYGQWLADAGVLPIG